MLSCGLKYRKNTENQNPKEARTNNVFLKLYSVWQLKIEIYLRANLLGY